jgi:hypothetical protein
MENWKKAVVTGSGALATILLIRGNRAAAFILGGVALAALASEYPETFARIRKDLPGYIERGTSLLEIASRIGERIADVAEARSTAWYEALLSE